MNKKNKTLVLQVGGYLQLSFAAKVPNATIIKIFICQKKGKQTIAKHKTYKAMQ